MAGAVDNGEVDLLVLDYLRERQHIKAMFAMESECGFAAVEFGPQIAFIRNLIFEGVRRPCSK